MAVIDDVRYRLTQRLWKVGERLLRRNRKRLCQPDDVLQGHIPFTPLDASDVVAMQPGALGQLFLRVAPFVAEPPQNCAKSGLNGMRGHPSMLEW